MDACAPCVLCACGVQRKALDPRDLELQVAVSRHVGDGHWAWILKKSSQPLSCLSSPWVNFLNESLVKEKERGRKRDALPDRQMVIEQILSSLLRIQFVIV